MDEGDGVASIIEEREKLMQRIAGIGRAIDLRYPTNRAIALIALAVTAGGALIRLLGGALLGAAGSWGLSAGLTVFFGWALGRELDPDHDRSAFVGAALALAGVVAWGLGGLGVAFWLLLVMRVVNRTTGRPATVLDTLGVVTLGAWQTYAGWWGIGALTVLALLLDWRLPPGLGRQGLLAGLALVAGAVALALGEGAGGGLAWPAGGLALALAALFAPVYGGAGRLASVGDATGEPLDPVRVRAAQAVALAAAILGALGAGADGLLAFMPLWAAAVGAAVYWLAQHFRSR
jgi:hypothetical protein